MAASVRAIGLLFAGHLVAGLLVILGVHYLPEEVSACGIAALGAAGGIAAALSERRDVRRARRVKRGRCECCDYDLTGNVSGVCPECGIQCVR